MSKIIHNISKTILLIFSVMIMNGCAATESYVASSESQHLDSASARIILHRDKFVVGAAVRLFILDQGEGAVKNGRMAVCKRRNDLSQLFYLGLNDGEDLLYEKQCMSAIDVQGNITMPTKEGHYKIAKNSDEIRPSCSANMYRWYEFDLIDVTVVGKIKQGDDIVWDRPPGVLSLVVMNKMYDYIIFAPDIQLEAGKTYHLRIISKAYDDEMPLPPFEIVVD
jgi:hypothetical protein